MAEANNKQYTKPTLTILQPTAELDKLFEEQLRQTGYGHARQPRRTRG